MKKRFFIVKLICSLFVSVVFNSCEEKDILVESISFNKDHLTLNVGEFEILETTVLPDNATDPSIIWTCLNEDIATIDEDGKVTAKNLGKTTIIARAGYKTTRCEVEVTFTRQSYPEEAGVTIGTTTWATRNIGFPGTFVDAPEDYGMFYQWNRPRGWASTGYEDLEDMPGWDNSMPESTTWQYANDPSPVGWQIPTEEQIDELLANTTNHWTPDYKGTGIAGCVFTDGINELFFPAAGRRSYGDGSLEIQGRYGVCWSRTQVYAGSAYCLTFDSYYNASWFNHICNEGNSVRCVRAE